MVVRIQGFDGLQGRERGGGHGRLGSGWECRGMKIVLILQNRHTLTFYRGIAMSPLS
jgi:hypothetical protein